MGRLREIQRTAAFAWSSSIPNPSIATGTRAGAVDADFSNETKLELWDLELSSQGQSSELQPVGSIVTDSRFYDIAWAPPNDDHSEGIIAGALENGSLDLWDAQKLREDASDTLISRTSKHSGAIKALQFNPHKPELLATSGAKGELYITDLNNAANPFRLGASAARADDFDALDWNKKVPHIMVTGSSGGFVTVWDVKAKKESLTLNNYGRKPVSAVAWNPDVPTKLATAIPSDQDPLILLWDLRNSSAPERILKGHDQGILSLSWCGQDNDLLLSCGKDNRNICWNPHTSEIVGEFPIVTNWTFETRFNPKHPNLLATASFDGKIGVETLQNTNSKVDVGTVAATQAMDGEDFFAKAQNQPQGASFTLSKPPKWLKKPVGVSFGFGGKIVSFDHPEENSNKSRIRISTFASDAGMDESIAELQKALKEPDLSQLCESKLGEERSGASKNDWKIMQALVSGSPRKSLLKYLGFENVEQSVTEEEINGDQKVENLKPDSQANGDTGKKENRLSAFFDNTGDNQNFLSDLAASKGARTNNPFQIYSGSESEEDKAITKALMLGSFDEALDICLKANRMSDAFMIAICGGQKCIDKAQLAYFGQKSEGPNYLRLLASVVGKNLWDIVYNADLGNWTEVMATLCTFADEIEFPDLCEALGDRLEEHQDSRKDASFCYLAGSKLEKLVPIWMREMDDNEKSRAAEAGDESAFSIHVQALQHLIEKVSIFRRVTGYEDRDAKEKSSGWKLDSLYAKYAEYAEVLATYGHLELADYYLSLLPAQYPAAEVARNRVRQATKKVPAATAAPRQQPAPAIATAFSPQGQMAGIPPQPQAGSYGPSSPAGPYGPTGYQPPVQPQSRGAAAYGGAYQPPPQNLSALPPAPPTTGPPPPRAPNDPNWNDLPDSFAPKPSSRRGTPVPAPGAVTNPFPNAPSPYQPLQPGQPPQAQPRTASPLPPPPKMGAPPRTGSPLVSPPQTSDLQRPPSSSAGSAYAPPQNQFQSGPMPSVQTQATTLPSMPNRTASPYNPPPAAGPPSNRYAPAPGSQPIAGPAAAAAPLPSGPSPYAPPQAAPTSNYAPQSPSVASQGPPQVPPPGSRGPPTGPPPGGARPPSSTGQPAPPPSKPRHPAGDRSHISPNAMPIYEVLNSEFQRIKARAPAQYKQHVDDVEKRLNVLFDLLNNDELTAENLALLKQLVSAIQARDFEGAQTLHTDLMKQSDQGGPWVVGVKRLIAMSKATPVN